MAKAVLSKIIQEVTRVYCNCGDCDSKNIIGVGEQERDEQAEYGQVKIDFICHKCNKENYITVDFDKEEAI